MPQRRMEDSPVKAKDLAKRAEKAFNITDQYRGMWTDAYKFCLPMRDQIASTQKGAVKGDEVFDSTGVNSAQAFANRISTLLFPDQQDFIQLEPGPAISFDDNDNITNTDTTRDELNGILADATKKFHTAIWRSNFGTAVGEMLLDLGIGTGIMQVLEGDLDNPLRFVPIAAPTVGLEEGSWGSIGAYYRKFHVPVGVIEEMWPGERGVTELPQALADKKAEDPTEEIELIEATHWDSKQRLWFYEIIYDKEEKLLAEPWVYEETSPWLAVRWTKAAHETWGRGPILYALADIRTANKVVELVLKNASMSVVGVYTGVDDGIFNPNTALLVPGAVIPVARNNGHPQGASLQPLQRTGDFDVSQLLLEELRSNIRRFLYDRGLPEETGPVRSATEIIKRLEELQMDIGAAFGRLMTELITPLVIRCLRVLAEQDILDFPIRIDGQSIKVRVTSPLAQQQNMEDLKAAMMWFEILGMMGPEFAMLNARLEDFGAWAAEKLGIDKDLVRTKEERGDIQQMMTQVMERMAQANAAAQPGAPQQGGAPAEAPAEPALQAAE